MSHARVDNHFVTIDGETKILAEWVEEYKDFGITRPLVLGRIARGWDVETAITKPPRKYGNNQRDSDENELA